MTRGILSSCYATLSGTSISIDAKGREQLTDLYREFYADEPFVRVVDVPPQTKQTWGNNYCLVYPTLDLRTGCVMVVSCIDNLVKGAAGQAIQNMNVMAGYPEETGLESLALFPIGLLHLHTSLRFNTSGVFSPDTTAQPLSSSGLGHRPFKAEITGSNPVGGTIHSFRQGLSASILKETHIVRQ